MAPPDAAGGGTASGGTAGASRAATPTTTTTSSSAPTKIAPQPRPVSSRPPPQAIAPSTMDPSSASSTVPARTASSNGSASPQAIQRSHSSSQHQHQHQHPSSAHHGAPSSSSSSSSSSAAAAAAAAAALNNPRAKKTLADALATSQGVTPPRKRKRVHYSCAECHRRKHRCDRNIPCQPCLDRGLGDQCRPFQDGDEFGDERDRLKRLEDLVEGLARAHATLADRFAAAMKGAGGSGSLATRAALGGSNGAVVGATSPTSSGTSANGASAAAANAVKDEAMQLSDSEGDAKAKRARIRRNERIDIERDELRAQGSLQDEVGQAGLYGGSSEDVENLNNPLEGGLTREGDSFYGALALPSVSRGVIETKIHGERLELSTNVPLRSASAKVHRLIQEGGAPSNVIDELMNCLPPREESDAMLEWYFRDINETRLPLHERTFRASYEEIMNWRWGDLRSEEGDDGARHIPFLSFLFVILAIAKRSEPEERSSDEEARRGALFFLHCARRSMAIANAVRADHIDVLLAALYGARLLITLRQSAESWSLLGVAIRAAQAIGLHRDGTKLGLDAVTTERRRRLWALIYYLDRTTSMLLGRPQGIDDKTSDTLPPSDVDIDVLPRLAPAPVPPPFPPLEPVDANAPRKPPGVYAMVAMRHELAKLTGRIVEHFQDLSKPRNYADVHQLDADLERFYQALPPPYLCRALRGDEADRSFDEICPWLPIHRYLLNVEYHYVRITLHRPYLLRSDRYQLSRAAAFASAKADRQIRAEYKREVHWPSNRARNSHLGGVYRLFSSTLIAGIELLLDPKGPNAPELHAMIDEFLNSSSKVSDPSQCTKRELAIIKIFKAKALDPSWCAATATGGQQQQQQQQQQGALGSQQRQADRGKPVGAKGSQSQQQASSDPANKRLLQQQQSTQDAQSQGPQQQQQPSLAGSGPQPLQGDLAQRLLDQLGGLESMQILNQNQSPSSTSSGSSWDMSGFFGTGGSLGGLGAANGLQAGDSAFLAGGSGGGGGGSSSNVAGAPMTSMPTVSGGVGSPSLAINVPQNPSGGAGGAGGFDGFFNPATTLAWNAGDSGKTDQAQGSNTATAEGAAGGTPAMLGVGDVAELEGVDSSWAAGWGTLVEAIVSGQEL
ncbi:hypothetical protein FA10DRAFT_280916 [Acaromyces ingoldii]|uniref:Zn(2)-C6 fungal-type domain-containing protein n=1 Tax=Acaromyces ingoldii TaxID=215250 RepID=A0A316YHQ3_9BASI|nr:hypothetical protein FA10DRAFT_280916 [Acaromyces ingoldii]PWN88374.1 hypothetical protein FA10DRAFT_280916 [Acaromyces ingoldii]